MTVKDEHRLIELDRIVYFIVDRKSGRRWAHNRWASPNSIPQIFAEKKSAEYQLSEQGKIGFTQKLFAGDPKYAWDPEIRVARISDTNMGIPDDYD